MRPSFQHIMYKCILSHFHAQLLSLSSHFGMRPRCAVYAFWAGEHRTVFAVGCCALHPFFSRAVHGTALELKQSSQVLILASPPPSSRRRLPPSSQVLPHPPSTWPSLFRRRPPPLSSARQAITTAGGISRRAWAPGPFIRSPSELESLQRCFALGRERL